MIYFAKRPRGRKIKIGKSNNPKRRVNELSSACGEKLEIIALMDAADEVEALLHDAFSDDGSFREWHRLSSPLECLLDILKAGFDPGPFLDSLIQVRVIERKIVSHDHARIARKPTRKTKKMNLSDEERKRRSEAIRKLHREGKIGGAKYGSLGGRPAIRGLRKSNKSAAS